MYQLSRPADHEQPEQPADPADRYKNEGDSQANQANPVKGVWQKVARLCEASHHGLGGGLDEIQLGQTQRVATGQQAGTQLAYLFQRMKDDLHRQEDENAQHIKAVVYCCRSKGAPKCVLVGDVSETDQSIGNGCPDIRPHDHRNRTHDRHAASHQTDNNGGHGTRRLDQRCCHRPDKQAQERVGGKGKEFSGLSARRRLEAGLNQSNRNNEPVDQQGDPDPSQEGMALPSGGLIPDLGC